MLSFCYEAGEFSLRIIWGQNFCHLLQKKNSELLPGQEFPILENSADEIFANQDFPPTAAAPRLWHVVLSQKKKM